jgi:hypothetical protein
VILPGCGGGDDATTGSAASAPARAPAETGPVTAAALAPSLGSSARQLERRSGSILRRSLDASLGPNAEIAIEAGSTRCRSGSCNPIRDESPPLSLRLHRLRQGHGCRVQTGFTLGFVVFNLHGRCWKATNERIAAAASGPVVLTRREALEPANVIAGCVGG